MRHTEAGKFRVLAAWILPALLCAGCQTPQPAETPHITQQAEATPPPLLQSVPEPESAVVLPWPREPRRDIHTNRQSPIDYLAGLTRLDADAARVELERLEASILRLGDDGDCSVECTRLALLLSTGVADVPRNVERALGLLDRALARHSDGILQQSYLLFARLWQQHLDALSRIDGLAARIDEQNRLIEALRMQIEELTALEQQLMKREGGLQP